MQGRTSTASPSQCLVAGLLAAALGAGCTPFERASDCAALAEAARPLSQLGTLEPRKEALGQAVARTQAVTAALGKLPKLHATLVEPKKTLQKQLGELTRDLESAEKALADDNPRAYSSARTRVLTREKSLSQTLATLTATCR